MPTTKHATKTVCPRCEVTFVAHVHCANLGCAFHIHVCDKCDKPAAVVAFMEDHGKDCTFMAPAQRAPLALVQRRAA